MQRPTVFDGRGSQSALAAGAGLQLAYGLSFSWSAVARYGFDSSQGLRTPAGAGATQEWRVQRHAATLGLEYAPSDALTPVFAVEAGLARRTLTDAVRIEEGTVETAYDAQSTVIPLARGSVSLRWMFADFWGVSGGPMVEYADGLGYGIQLSISASSYLF